MAVAMDVGWRSSPGLRAHSRKRGLPSSWGDDQHKLLKLMIGKPGVEECTVPTLDLLGGCAASTSSEACTRCEEEELEIDMELPPPPFGWEKRLDLKIGKFYYVNTRTGTTTYDHPSSTQTWDLRSELEKMGVMSGTVGADELDLKLNLGTPSGTSKGMSTIEAVQEALARASKWKSQQMPRRGILSPGSSTSNCCSSDTSSSSSNSSSTSCSVVLTGCKRCLMYVMLSRSDPRCPKCGSYVAVDDGPLQQHDNHQT